MIAPKKIFICISIVALTVTVINPAYAADKPAKNKPSSAKQEHQTKAKKKAQKNKQEPPKHLPKLNIHGHKISPTEIICFLRTALTAQRSRDPAKADDVVCRIHQITGSHFNGLFCKTNRQYFDQAGTSAAATGGRLDAPITRSWGMNGKNVHPINKGKFLNLVKSPRTATICRKDGFEN